MEEKAAHREAWGLTQGYSEIGGGSYPGACSGPPPCVGLSAPWTGLSFLSWLRNNQAPMELAFQNDSCPRHRTTHNLLQLHPFPCFPNICHHVSASGSSFCWFIFPRALPQIFALLAPPCPSGISPLSPLPEKPSLTTRQKMHRPPWLLIHYPAYFLSGMG